MGESDGLQARFLNITSEEPLTIPSTYDSTTGEYTLIVTDSVEPVNLNDIYAVQFQIYGSDRLFDFCIEDLEVILREAPCEPDVSHQCDSNGNIRSVNSCGILRDIIETCKAPKDCDNTFGPETECACPYLWTGEDCDRRRIPEMNGGCPLFFDDFESGTDQWSLSGNHLWIIADESVGSGSKSLTSPKEVEQKGYFFATIKQTFDLTKTSTDSFILV